MRTIMAAVLALATGGVCGCGRESAPATQIPTATPAGRQPNPTYTVTETLLGKSALDSGRRAGEKVRAISAERNQDLEQAMGEDK